MTGKTIIVHYLTKIQEFEVSFGGESLPSLLAGTSGSTEPESEEQALGDHAAALRYLQALIEHVLPPLEILLDELEKTTLVQESLWEGREIVLEESFFGTPFEEAHSSSDLGLKRPNHSTETLLELGHELLDAAAQTLKLPQISSLARTDLQKVVRFISELSASLLSLVTNDRRVLAY